jgi:hypothetical protein
MAVLTLASVVLNEVCVAETVAGSTLVRYSVAAGVHGARCYLPLSAFNTAEAKSFVDVRFF